MITVAKFGKSLSGCLRSVMSEGREPSTLSRRPAAASDAESRVAWIGGQNFIGDWPPQNRDDAELMRKVMEYYARPENQSSATRKCEKVVLHLMLSWRIGETPARAEMEQAAKEALAAIGMERARALFVAHRDTANAHVHIVASRIDPETGLTFQDSHSFLKWRAWAHDWELRHGQVQCPARERRSQLHAAREECGA